jgi:HAE1 family hydrophobic/amphiphilic exporter-1
VLFDRSITIRASVEEVKLTLYLALMLVVMVIFLSCATSRRPIIPSLALPMSIIGTFSVMYLFGYSLDNISLMALDRCASASSVDDAIVMLENITRHLEQGKSVMQATLEGSREIVFTIISMTISLAAVFIRCCSWAASSGAWLHEFAVTIMPRC